MTKDTSRGAATVELGQSANVAAVRQSRWRIPVGILMIAAGAALLVVNFAGLSRNLSAINGGGSFGVLAVILSAWGVSVWTDTDANWRGAPYVYTFAGGFVVVGVVSWLIEGDWIWLLWCGLAGMVLAIRLVHIRRTRITVDSDASES